MDVRVSAAIAAVDDKAAALSAYAASIDKLPKALAASQKDVQHPDRKAIEASIKDFVTDAKDSHDKIAKAFPHAF